MDLAKIQAKLRGHPVQVVQRGQSLYLQAVLPDKRGMRRPYQQRIALGVRATPMGFDYALGKALELSAALVQRRFSWELVDGKKQVQDWVLEFRQHKIQSDGIKPDTWERHYSRFFIDGEMSMETAVRAIVRYKANSQSRRRACQVWTALAKFAGLSWDLSAYRGTYNATKTQKLDIPTDDELLAIAENLRGRSVWYGWFALQLCYGLRTHEPQYARLVWDEELNVFLCHVSQGKTGSRIVYPLPYQWPERLLGDGYPMPQVEGENYGVISDRAATAYRRLGIIFPPRTLRYAYVVRGVVRLGFSVPEVAGWCGHSPSVLLSTYSRYINAATARDSYRKRAMGA